MVTKTVLVVEDDPFLRIAAEEMFAAAGEQKGSLFGALCDDIDSLIGPLHGFRLQSRDVQTPGPIDGIGLARVVKTHWPHVEVLVTSGSPVSKAVPPVGVRFTSKPWSRKDVLEMARTAVAV